jgi:hypothetical protein
MLIVIIFSLQFRIFLLLFVNWQHAWKKGKGFEGGTEWKVEESAEEFEKSKKLPLNRSS